jgi:DNA-directed RNA polymerase subunit M/transcription elongation factor TFIIS
MPSVPVICPECGEFTFVIEQGDKLYCTNCDYNYRISEGTEASRRAYKYYVHCLENEVLKSRGVNIERFRLGQVDGSRDPKKFLCKYCERHSELYMLKSSLWTRLGLRFSDTVCLTCLERLLGRSFVQEDFKICGANRGWMKYLPLKISSE